MAGSQLKQLKATLKAHGLTGQTNIKKNKKNTKRQAKDYDREQKINTINKIREQFNPFEIKSNKSKGKILPNATRDSSDARIAVGKPGISKQIGEEQRRKNYEVKKQIKNRKGGLIDRRFGERDKNLTEEEKMLERFTRERQSQSKKRSNLFNLNDDDDEIDDDELDIFGSKLTHAGKGLPMDDDENDDGMALGNSKRSFDEVDMEDDTPKRKKTKAEVMQEIIAKSKFYKSERQKAQRKLEDEIDEVDENFDDILSELLVVDKKKTKAKQNDIETKSTNDMDYDMKVKELLNEKRAVPADRTKTEEETQKENEEKMKKLEQQRLDRMSGMLELEDGEEKGVEDLDDGFWNNSDEEDDGNNDIADSDDDIKLDDLDENDEKQEHDNGWQSANINKNASIICPSSHSEFLNLVSKKPLMEHVKTVRKIIQNYQPKLAEGNKEKMGKLATILLRHIMFLSDQKFSTNIEEFSKVQNLLINILKQLTEKYNAHVATECRKIVIAIQQKFKNGNFDTLNISDLIFFIIVGILFSTSDHYHLVATPAVILMCEFLEQIKFNTMTKFAFGAVILNILLQYQRLSKRFIPEMIYFYEKSLCSFLGNSNKIDIRIDSNNFPLPKDTSFNDDDCTIVELHKIFDHDENKKPEFQKTVLLNILSSMDICISNIWKELPAFTEIVSPLNIILTEYSEKFESLSQVKGLIHKLENLQKFNTHIPLTLQDHKPVAIPSNAPKYEDNFNPDKKSYDPDPLRNEVNKMKAQIKKERKFTMKEIRKDAKFEARQQISEKKKANEEYHAKMAHIYNTISTEEGAEKNKYEREKKLRNSKR